MSTHTAIVTTSKGELKAILVPTPTPGPGEVLIKVSHSSLIGFDSYQTYDGFAVTDYPHTLGFNAAGIIKDVGEGIVPADLKVGDRVLYFPELMEMGC
jgi:NADPH:quinone reductase-like Zn-dependent oxidoreductase